MFGYVTVNREALSEAEERRFRAFYCGLCHALGRRHGATGCLALSYDMAFLALTLSSLYEPETTFAVSRCAPHPSKKHEFAQNSVIDYAADMTVALAHQKALDDWMDERSIVGLSGARATKSRYTRIAKAYPQKVSVIERCLSDLSELQKSGCLAIDPPANAFGALLGEIFVYRQDIWSDTLRRMGEGLGRFVYLMDAYEDLDADQRAGRYNPLIGMRDDPDFEERCKAFLTLLIADATEAFEKLPLVEDIGLLRNILYSGVWAKYQCIRRKRDGKGRIS